MQIIDNLMILGLIVASFIAGMKLSTYYHEKIIDYAMYVEKILAAEKGLGYIAPPAKHVSQEFMDRLHEVGHATQAL